jgi:hypothetical protein
MRFPRMTMRRWMIAVAVAGLCLGAAVCGRRLKHQRDIYLERASMHARLESWFRSLEKAFRPAFGRDGASRKAISGIIVRSGLAPALIAVGEHTYLASALARYHAELKKKYLHFAARPWITMPPEPPL